MEEGLRRTRCACRTRRNGMLRHGWIVWPPEAASAPEHAGFRFVLGGAARRTEGRHGFRLLMPLSNGAVRICSQRAADAMDCRRYRCRFEVDVRCARSVGRLTARSLFSEALASNGLMALDPVAWSKDCSKRPAATDRTAGCAHLQWPPRQARMLLLAAAVSLSGRDG